MSITEVSIVMIYIILFALNILYLTNIDELIINWR